MSNDLKSLVSQEWIMGKTRDKIASEFKIGKGTVSNIISEWKNMIGTFDADSIRELAIGMKKAGSTPGECLRGLRMSNQIEKFGIDPEELEYFLNTLYKECITNGVRPADLSKILKETSTLPEINLNSINEIPKCIKEKQLQKLALDIQVDEKTKEINNMNIKLQIEEKKIQDLQNYQKTFQQKIQDQEKDFLLFIDYKNQLQQNNIPIQYLQPMANIIRIFKKDFNFQPMKIFQAFSKIENYQKYSEAKDQELKEKEFWIKKLESLLALYKNEIGPYQKEELDRMELQNMGFDLSDFKQMYSVLQEIAEYHNMNLKEVKRVFYGILNKCPDLFCFYKEILDRQTDISVLEQQIDSNRIILKAQPEVYACLLILLKKGFNESDLLNILSIFETDYTKPMPFDARNYLENLCIKLKKYRTVSNTLASLNTELLLKETKLNKLVEDISKLEALRLSQFLNIYFNSIILNIQKIQLQKKLPIILVCPIKTLLLFCAIKNSKTSFRANHKQENNKTQPNNNSKENGKQRQEKTPRKK